MQTYHTGWYKYDAVFFLDDYETNNAPRPKINVGFVYRQHTPTAWQSCNATQTVTHEWWGL